MNAILRHLRTRRNAEWIRNAESEAKRLYPSNEPLVVAQRHDVAACELASQLGERPTTVYLPRLN